MRFLFLTILFGTIAVVFPLGTWAGVKEGNDENFSWKVEWPSTIKVDVPATIRIEASSPNNLDTIFCDAPGKITPPGSKSCLGASSCFLECGYTGKIEGPAVLPIKLWDKASPPNEKKVEVPLYVCAGTICFENPLTSMTFWQLFNRVIGFVLVVGLAIGPILLLYGVFRFMTSAGDAKKGSDAMQIIKYTMVGIVILLLARGIMAILVRVLLG